MGKSAAPFHAGTVGYRFLNSIAMLSAENLRARERSLERRISFSVDDECHKQACLQAVRSRLTQIALNTYPAPRPTETATRGRRLA